MYFVFRDGKYIDAAGQSLAFSAVDLGEQIRRQLVDSFCLFYDDAQPARTSLIKSLCFYLFFATLTTG
jgi:hypothetical protein